MDTLARALGPAFAAGFAIEQLLEVIDALLGKIFPCLEDPDSKWKRIILGTLSFLVGIVLVQFSDISVLQPFGVAAEGFADDVITALVISAGTEGLNSIIKFIWYGKEDTKAKAEIRKAEAETKKADAEIKRAEVEAKKAQAEIKGAEARIRKSKAFAAAKALGRQFPRSLAVSLRWYAQSATGFADDGIHLPDLLDGLEFCLQKALIVSGAEYNLRVERNPSPDLVDRGSSESRESEHSSRQPSKIDYYCVYMITKTMTPCLPFAP
ncbi:MAG: hypothetical protein ACYTEQ_05500 [Planctomycetota bacterium]|jgi:hypothetical protein